MNVAHLLLNTASHSGDRIATVYGDRGVTYGEHVRRVRAMAASLRERGLREGDHVAYLMNNRPEILEVAFACWYAGLVLVPLNVKFTRDELTYHISDSEARAIVCDVDFLQGVADVAQRLPLLDVVIAVSGSVGAGTHLPGGSARISHLAHYEDEVARNINSTLPPIEVDAHDVAWLFYTSGTTGKPKGAMLSHANLNFVVVAWAADMMPLNISDVTLHVAPLTHGAGFHMLAAVGQGCKQVFPSFPLSASTTAELLDKHRITNTWMVPTQVIRLVQELKTRPRRLPHLHSLLYGGAPFHRASLNEAVDQLGTALVQLYAQGESPMTATCLPHWAHSADHEKFRGSVGVVRTGMRVKIFDLEGNECEEGRAGEICIQGPSVMNGYWRKPLDTKETLKGGWLHTGDLGYFNEGYLFVSGRIKDLIITGGSNVYAKEVEDTLLLSPDVREVAVVGVPDAEWGEKVVAFVVLSESAALDEEVLKGFCKERLSSYKVPKIIVEIPELPLSAYGKVLKAQLRSMMEGV